MVRTVDEYGRKVREIAVAQCRYGTGADIDADLPTDLPVDEEGARAE